MGSGSGRPASHRVQSNFCSGGEPMDILSREHLEFLSTAPHRLCVSVFLPMHRAGKEVLQDPVRLKNLLKEAEDGLLAHGLSKVKARELLAPGRQFERQGGFWRHQSAGLALFLAPGFFQYFRLPLSFNELVIVSERFEIKPLLPLFNAGGRFYLLALSQKEVRLFEGTPYGLSQLELPGVPHSIQDTIQYDIRESQHQVHSGTGAPGANRKQGAVFHGQAVGLDDAKSRVLQYFLDIDKGLRRFLNAQTAPLVLAAVKEWFPIYREANSYKHLLDEGVEGNPANSNPQDLHQASLRILRPSFEEAQNQAKALYRELVSSGRTSKDLKETVRSAYQGRVQFVFLPVGVHRWGSFDPQNDALQTHKEPQPGDEDLLNLIAIQTILRSGSVYAVPPDDMPEDSHQVAAAFRY